MNYQEEVVLVLGRDQTTACVFDEPIKTKENPTAVDAVYTYEGKVCCLMSNLKDVSMDSLPAVTQAQIVERIQHKAYKEDPSY